MGKLIAFGEVLEDYVPEGDGFKKLVGGAPLNLLSMASQLGASTYMITGLGSDEGSDRVLSMMKTEHVNSDYVKFDDATTLCHTEVVVDKTTGEREFYFFKDKASFLSLRKEDIRKEWFEAGDIFHFGTVCLLNDSVYEAQLCACKYASEAGCLISFDPNFRPTLFKEEEQKRLSLSFLPFVDILKLGEDEMKILVGSSDAKELFRQFPNVKLLFLTKGADGIELVFNNGKKLFEKSVKPSRIVDTVGCGDCSFGAFLSVFLNKGLTSKDDIDKLDDEVYQLALRYATKAGSLLCEQQGAIPVPSKDRFGF